MGSFTPAGTNITARYAFNNAQLDFGSNRLVAIKNVSLSTEWSLTELYILNSIKMADLVRHSMKVTLEGKLVSYAPEMDMLVMGSSIIGTPLEIDALDGQPTLQNPVLTIFDRNQKEIQYQLSGALFKSNKLTTSSENFAEWDFSLEAKDIIELVTV